MYLHFSGERVTNLAMNFLAWVSSKVCCPSPPLYMTPNLTKHRNKFLSWLVVKVFIQKRSYTVFFIILYPPPPWFFLETKVKIKIVSHSCYPINLWLILTEMKQKKNIFEKKKNQNGRLKKLSFSTTTKTWAIFSKISQIGPWVSRIDWCEGH